MRLLYLAILLANCTFSQKQFSGQISDAGTGQPVPFASIGIAGKSTGTLSDENGNFSFKFPGDADSLRIQAIGYKSQTIFTGSARNEVLKISLESESTLLDEVEISSKKLKTGYVGSPKYDKNNCSGFVKNEQNWKGSQAAILAGNKAGRKVWLSEFSFYIIKNLYTDSILFRLMFYEVSEKGYPRLKTFLRKPIIFKMGQKQGEFFLDLKNYNLSTSGDFFISLECLQDEMDISKFCYAGSYDIPSFVKTSPFGPWIRVRGGGADFKVKVAYEK